MAVHRSACILGALTGPRISGKELPGQNHGLSFIMPTLVTRYAVFHANGCFLNAEQVIQFWKVLNSME